MAISVNGNLRIADFRAILMTPNIPNFRFHLSDAIDSQYNIYNYNMILLPYVPLCTIPY